MNSSLSELTAVQSPEDPPSSNPAGGDGSTLPHIQMTTEELVAKCIAPVKREFIRPPSTRPPKDNHNSVNTPNDDVSEAPPFHNPKKSRRQLKRERRQERSSPLHLCAEVSRSGIVSSCPYGDKCRFSHDVEAFKAQKPVDLEGNCPFLDSEGPCPYALSCRFAGTHKDDVNGGTTNGHRNSSEVNSLNKDVQKLLWKNKMKFLKANAVLTNLGLLGNGKLKKFEENEEDVQTVTDELALESVNNSEESPKIIEKRTLDTSVANESRPEKKAKPSNDENLTNNGSNVPEKTSEQNDLMHTIEEVTIESDKSLKLHPREKKIIDFRDKLYLAPLTTVGNLPFRRVCKVLGADVTCGEMAMSTNLLQGQASEWALLRRHSSENIFGVQICGAYPDTISKTVQLIEEQCSIDFIDINMGCPIDLVTNKGAGSALLNKPMRMKSIIQAASSTIDTPLTIKVRTGFFEGRSRINSIISDIGNWGASSVTIHGRTRQQRYSKLADWEYIYDCARKANGSVQVLGNGDVYSYLDWNMHKSNCPELSSCMIARGALIKPWIFTEIKEQRHWDISSGERLNILKDYVNFGLQHWGSDSKGVETTRHFLLEWLSYTCRYIPVGLLDVIPQKINWRAPSYYGRDELETLMASDSANDWIKISELVLGKVPAGFIFAPKHKSNAYDRAENG